MIQLSARQEKAEPESRKSPVAGGDLSDPLAGGSLGEGATDSLVSAVSAPGTAVQMDGDDPKSDPSFVRDQAKKATSGGGSALPHKGEIQKAFGPYDVSGVKSHVGGKAAEATDAIGANGLATGDHVAFGEQPSLHTAAHEAAHVVQQQSGVQLEGGVGAVGDRYEQHADAVADAVVSGQSAVQLLSAGPGVSGGSTGVQQSSAGVQLDGAPEKKVSAKAMGRLGKAKAAISHTKAVLSHGAGNQAEALKATNFNSYYRLAAMRDPKAWVIDPSVIELAKQYPEALTAAKADLAQGGNCGEHAMLAFDYLRRNASSEVVNRAHKQGLDHAFVLIGDTTSEKDDEIVAADPWPTAATACVWEDHFAFTADRSKLSLDNTISGDSAEVKSIIASGLSLSDFGKEMAKRSLTEAETKEQLKKGTAGDHPWIWEHADAANKDYKYVGPDGKDLSSLESEDSSTSSSTASTTAPSTTAPPTTTPPTTTPPATTPSVSSDGGGSSDSGGSFIAWIRSVLGL